MIASFKIFIVTLSRLTRYVELIDVVLYSRLVCLSINTHVHERWGLVLMDFLVWVLIGLGLGRDYAKKKHRN